MKWQPKEKPRIVLPLDILHQCEQTAGGANEFVQEAHNIAEFGPVAALLLPAVQHELVQGQGAAHGRGQAVALLNG